jgi:hypothetical protein
MMDKNAGKVVTIVPLKTEEQRQLDAQCRVEILKVLRSYYPSISRITCEYADGVLSAITPHCGFD